MKVFKAILFWVVEFTWGLPLTLIGSFGALYMLITRHKPYRFGLNIYFVANMDGGWGFEGGPFFFCSRDCVNDLELKIHECGHGTLQNFLFGPLEIFLVTIPSLIRFWYRVLFDIYDPPYNSIWFEAQADKLGEKFYSWMITEGYRFDEVPRYIITIKQ